MNHLYKNLVVCHVKGLGIVTKEDSLTCLDPFFQIAKVSRVKVDNIYMGYKLYQNYFLAKNIIIKLYGT